MAKPPDPVHLLLCPNGSVTCIDFLTDSAGKLELITGSDDGVLSIWSMDVLRPRHSWIAHKSPILWLTSNTTSNCIVTQSKEELSLWDVSGTLLKTIPLTHQGFCKCDIFQSGILVPEGNNSVGRYLLPRIDEPVCKVTVRTEYGLVTAVKFLSEDDFLSSYENGNIIKWHQDRQVARATVPHMTTCLAHATTKTGAILVGTVAETLYIFNENLESQREISLTNPGLSSIAVRADGKTIVTGGWDHRIRIFNGNNYRLLCVLKCHTDTVQHVAFPPDGHFDNFVNHFMFFASSKDGLISVWDVYSQPR